MRRRELLQGLSTLALSQMVLGCQSGSPIALQVYLLRNALPPQLLRQARRAMSDAPNLKVKADLSDLFQQLESWQQQAASASPPRLVSLGDYWLAPAIRQKLIQPLDLARSPRWSTLPSRWQDLVRRDRNGSLTDAGDLWGAPYRWGMTLLAYRRDKFKSLGWTPTDWSDLWRPELKNRFSLPDQAREVIGLTLKTLQQSYNAENPANLEALLPKLKSLDQQVKFYDSTHYLEPLIMGDAWAAVGWSADILPILKREPEIRVVAPASGTALWADLWVQSSQSDSGVIDWVDFWWKPEISEALSQFTAALSPLLQDFSLPQSQLAPLLADNAIFENSEFLTPLSEETRRQFQDLWQQMRLS
ncbi:MAG: extracellular solute-binding protein [Cyanobacteria bacterium P01_A01_bin.17]